MSLPVWCHFWGGVSPDSQKGALEGTLENHRTTEAMPGPGAPSTGTSGGKMCSTLHARGS